MNIAIMCGFSFRNPSNNWKVLLQIKYLVFFTKKPFLQKTDLSHFQSHWKRRIIGFQIREGRDVQSGTSNIRAALSLLVQGGARFSFNFDP